MCAFLSIAMDDMMKELPLHTLAQLQSGELKQQHIKRLQIAEQLTTFPLEILTLSDSLEVLDLSNNRLSSLPDEFASLAELKILFLSFNCFTEIPSVIAQCPKLEMIGFKANQIESVPENCFPVDTRWLILTDNQITHLPESMGQLHRLKKCALAGNVITQLPDSMQNCHELELLRISANKLASVPDWLLSLPKLAWLAFSGNPVTQSSETHADFLQASISEFVLGDQLGQGASGVIYQAQWNKAQLDSAQTSSHQTVALKMFKGAVTSDGYPKDELHCCLSAGEHPNLIKVLAQIAEGDDLGLVMEIIPSGYYNLGLPPSLITCTRDTFADEMSISLDSIIKVMASMAGALAHLHQQKVSHGDIYAHNTMIDDSANILFGDFGAATDLNKLSVSQVNQMQAIEVRAFGNMLEDLLGHYSQSSLHESSDLADKTLFTSLLLLTEQCLNNSVSQRPSFNELAQQISSLR